MCIVLNEQGLLELMRTPKRLIAILDTDASVALEIQRFDGECTTPYCYCIVDMSRQELYEHALKLKRKMKRASIEDLSGEGLEKLDIDNGIWYKYFEEKYATISPSTVTPLIAKGNIMLEKTNEITAPTVNWTKMLKNGGIALALMLVGGVAGNYMAKRSAEKTETSAS
jgi:hypothetical protein